MTIKKIAEISGVSIGTVDRVLHNRGKVSKELEARVLNAIEELKYSPNIFARQLKLSKSFDFGVLMPELSQDSFFWQIPAHGINRAAKELKTHRVQVHYFFFDRNSKQSFSRACKKAMDSNLEGLLIAPVLFKESEVFISKIPASLPYVFFDSYIPHSNCLSYVVHNSFMSGRLASRLMHILHPSPCSLAAIRIMPRSIHIDERVRGFTEYFASLSGYQISIYEAGQSSGFKAVESVTEQILKKHPDVKGIFVSNALTHSAAQCLVDYDKASEISVIGYDLTEENVRHLKDSTIDFLICQQSEQQGYHALYLLFRHVVLKESVPDKILTPLDIITKENVDYRPIYKEEV